MVIFAGMKGNNCGIYLLSFCMMVLVSVSAYAQPGWTVRWEGNAYFNGSTAGYLPFWQRTGHDGILPYTSAAVLTAGADLKYKADNGIFFETGTNLAAQAMTASTWKSGGVNGIVDRLYVSAGWKMLHLDVGMKPRERELGTLSLTGGNILFTGNARNMPGLNAWSDWIWFEKGHWFGIRGNFAHYQMLDPRYVTETMIHNKSFAFKVALGRKVDLEAGLDHWAQWGGVSPAAGRRPSSFNDYLRVILAKKGGGDATLSDQRNALGNHLGREYVRLTWRATAFDMVFQYDLPFEDGGQIIKLEPFPDGVYTLRFSFKEKQRFVNEILYEFANTTWQSGPVHDRPATEEEMSKDYGKYVYWQDPDHHYYGRIVPGGKDDYFNNSEYRSGWTYYGRAMCLPLMIPFAPGEDGITRGIVSNRVRAHHIGLKGLAWQVPYSFKATYSSNWGRYFGGDQGIFASRPKQLSLALEVELSEQVTNIPVAFVVGAYGDLGKVYRNSAGLSLRVIYGGSHSLRR